MELNRKLRDHQSYYSLLLGKHECVDWILLSIQEIDKVIRIHSLGTVDIDFIVALSQWAFSAGDHEYL